MFSKRRIENVRAGRECSLLGFVLDSLQSTSVPENSQGNLESSCNRLPAVEFIRPFVTFIDRNTIKKNSMLRD